MPRLFIAIDIPDAIREDLSRFSADVPEARWVPPDQNHLTLRFIGDVQPPTVSALKTALSGLSFAPFQLELRGVGHFPPGKRPPRVLWVGIGENAQLLRLQQAVESAVQQAGIAPEERPFSPHLTLARLKEPHGAAVSAFEQRHRDLAYPPFEVKQAILFSSVLTPKGAIHRKELVVPAA
ncbi:RNA 2',3'-cyclic phosphodiesterase [Geomonas silvestris]|uniref:RNA 2',3'-cyclic phosphodiesterase n=1 Tax=Geomonas silvestris TaxID=2740184 RepID=A0A6V8MFY9_9BACT|nr:RNA 2',3'-cyclic phosphodiesterase [Geomonas silvestris]GFO58862.1 RNA 2',3'-cyclic phosphodiesterase [Geomonas silvestris]